MLPSRSPSQCKGFLCPYLSQALEDAMFQTEKLTYRFLGRTLSTSPASVSQRTVTRGWGRGQGENPAIWFLGLHSVVEAGWLRELGCSGSREGREGKLRTEGSFISSVGCKLPPNKGQHTGLWFTVMVLPPSSQAVVLAQVSWLLDVSAEDDPPPKESQSLILPLLVSGTTVSSGVFQRTA